MSTMTSVRVIISGLVQGVFFRVETQRAATAAGVYGWVRNLPDRTVEALFEGPEEKVKQMEAWCWKGSPGARVDQVRSFPMAYTGAYKDFKITG